MSDGQYIPPLLSVCVRLPVITPCWLHALHHLRFQSYRLSIYYTLLFSRYLLKVLLDSLCMKLHYVNDPACCLHSTLQLAQCGLILVCLLNVNRQYNCPPRSLLGIVLRMEYQACLSYSLKCWHFGSVFQFCGDNFFLFGIANVI